MTTTAHRPASQSAQILHHLTHQGPITALDALNRYACFRLAARIKDLRDQGHDIRTTDTTTPAGAHIAKYTLRLPTQPELF